ncbi:hypothetical protein [Clostridium butyricum]|uniref:hypothetical protein n=1 Tax=Clostridium butyricum TaxID=1492 RepID=UPI0012F967B2|nr:hypothetical protein [Clostridium butyricum]
MDWYEDKEKLELKLLYWEDYYIKQYKAVERGYNKEYTLSKVMCGDKALQFKHAKTTLEEVQRFVIAYAQENNVSDRRGTTSGGGIDEEAQKRAELEEQYKLNPFKEMFIARDLRRWREERDLATGKVKKPYGL